jgi:hypothetical protein
LRTFGSTLMLFLFICAILFICVISGFNTVYGLHGLRTFGSTLMLFPFICGIPFIRVICGSLVTVLFNHRWHGLRTFGSTQITTDVVSIHPCHPFPPRNLRFPWQLFFLPRKPHGKGLPFRVTSACLRQAGVFRGLL